MLEAITYVLSAIAVLLLVWLYYRYWNSLLFTIVDDGDLTTSQIIARCRKRFCVDFNCSDEDLDKDFPPPPRVSARKFDAEDLRGKKYTDISIGDSKTKSLSVITLRERLLLEIQYFDKVGQHLDSDGVTVCASPNGDNETTTVVFLNSEGLVIALRSSKDHFPIPTLRLPIAL